MTDELRRASVRLSYNHVDATVDVAPDLLSFSWVDGLEKSDDLQVKVKDDEGKWRGAWAPEYGDTLQAWIVLDDGTGAPSTSLPCGIFKVDDPEYDYPPWTCLLKASSAYVTTSLRVEKKHKGHESITLKDLAAQIASRAGLQLFWDSPTNPTFGRADQTKQSDLAYLSKRAKDYGLRVKVSDGQLILFDQAAYDTKPVVKTITPADIVNGHFVYGAIPLYVECVVKWHDPKGGKVYQAVYRPAGLPSTGQALRLTERCESNADALRIAQFRLQEANRGLKESTASCVGDTVYASGSNVATSGFGGVLDGRWAIEEARHSLWPYVTELKLRKLNG